MLAEDPGLGDLARRLYDVMEPRRYARIAGTAAVGLALSGRGAPPVPAWLAARSPLRVLWDWADGIARGDAAALRAVSARFRAMECPYEAALALRDAGDLAEAYRMLRQLGAVAAREQIAVRLRAAGAPVPRRSRAAVEQDALTDTQRVVCRLVAAGARNTEIAAQLDVSLRTVEAHLGQIYEKTGVRGKVALATWWTQREDG